MSSIEGRFAGFGGQGVVLAGFLLGTAAVNYDAKKAVQTQSYGAEARGGAARSDVIISDETIVYPQTRRLDILVALSAASLERYLDDLKPGGTLIVDDDLVEAPAGPCHKVYGAHFTNTAIAQVGRSIAANVVMVGFLTGVTGIVSREAMQQAIRDTVPSGTEEMNLRAFGLGLEMAQQHGVRDSGS